MDEKSLVRRYCAGDPGARQEMYENYAGRLLAVCRRYIRDPDRARDLVHDTFLRAWDALDRFRPRRNGSLGAWLGRIASRLAVDELRRQKHFSLLSGSRGRAAPHSGGCILLMINTQTSPSAAAPHCGGRGCGRGRG